MSARYAFLSLLTCLVLIMPPTVAGDAPPAKAQDHTDRYGDPLPAGAIARLGTVRFRHGNGILALAFSPDGKTLAAGDADGHVSIWDVVTGKELHCLPRVENQILPMVISPDGKFLAFATYSGQIIYLHDTTTGKRLHKLTLDSGGLHALAFSPDSKVLAWGSHDKAVHLWDVASAKEHGQLKGFESTIGFLAFAPDGKTLLVGSTDLVGSTTGTISQRDLKTARELRRFTVDRDGAGVAVETSPHLAALSPNGKRLVSVAGDGTLRLWQLASGEEVWRVKPGDNRWNTLSYAPDGKFLAVAEWNRDKRIGVVKLRDAASGREIRRLRVVEGAVRRIVFSPDGKMIALAGWSNCLRFFDPATGAELPRGGGHQGPINTVCFCRDGKWVVTGGWDSSVRIWETTNWRELHRLEGDGSRCCRAACFGGRYLALMGDTDTVRVWDTITEKEVCRHQAPGEMPWWRSFSSKGETPVHDARASRINIWDVQTGEIHRRIDIRWFQAQQMVVSADGRMLAVCNIPGETLLWNLATGRRYSLGLAGGFVFSADGRTLGSGESPVLWETTTGKKRVQMRGGRDIFTRVAFSPDGHLLASGGSDGTVHIWDPATGRELANARAHRGWMRNLAFSPDGRQLVSVGEDTTALVWDVQRILAAAPAGRKVTAEELKSLWSDLASDDAARAYRAIHALRSAGSPAVRLLAENLRLPKPPKERKDIARFLADLNSDDFATREKAARQLEKLGPWAEPHLRAKLKERPSLEMRKRLEALLMRLDDQEKREPRGEMLRTLRAMEALEMIGTLQARAVLETLAKDAGDTRLMRTAKESLARLKRRFPR